MADNYSLRPIAQPNNEPNVSVIICTRNRGSSIVETIESIINSGHPSFELLVIDQSTNNETRNAIQPFLSDQRFCYIPTPTKGKGFACNLGLQSAKSDIVIYTDDDCIVSSNFLPVMENLFNSHPQVALAFCSVVPGMYDFSKGTIPQVKFKKDRIIHSFSPYHLLVVMGAGMAMRKSVITHLGGFDSAIGPGSLFYSGDDVDLAMRTLSTHHCVYQLSQDLVTHYGFRTFEEYRPTIAHNFYGLGAIHAKFAKTWDLRILPFILFNVMIKCFWQPLIGSLRNRRLQGFRRVIYYAQGFNQGLKTPVDKNNLLYRL